MTTYIFYIIFGILPSLIWLLYYLREDVHPESAKMILKIFFFGALAALPAVLIEMGIFSAIQGVVLPAIFLSIFNVFFGVALIEELLKFLVFKGKVLNSSEFDEPLDAVLYMIIAALGFAAAENTLILFSLGPVFMFQETLQVTLFRFIGATFLHALVSGLLGYFLALSFCEIKIRNKVRFIGILVATFLHGLYNFSIIEMDGPTALLIPSFILVSLAITLTLAFRHLKKIKSICKI